MKKNKENLLQKIFILYNNCKIKNPSKKRDLSNRFVVWNILIKFITFLPAHALVKLKISPDLITLLSLFFIPIGCYLVLIEYTLLGATCWVVFGALDSLDGDMARLSKEKLFMEKLLIPFGADIFYFLTPMTIRFYLFNYNLGLTNNFNPNFYIVIGFLISFFNIHTLYGL